jgi:hypothetical protein
MNNTNRFLFMNIHQWRRLLNNVGYENNYEPYGMVGVIYLTVIMYYAHDGAGYGTFNYK